MSPKLSGVAQGVRRRRATGGPAAGVGDQLTGCPERACHGGQRAASGDLPVDRLASWGLHLVGLPSHADMLALRRQLNEVQREVATLRELANAERVQDSGDDREPIIDAARGIRREVDRSTGLRARKGIKLIAGAGQRLGSP